MSKWPYIAASCSCLFVSIGGIAVAQSQPQQATAQSSQSEQDLAAATCGEYLDAANLANPGDNPSKKRKEQAEAAQDSLVDSMLWVHGYQTGKTGTVQPLTNSWMIKNIRALAESCRRLSPDGRTLLVDAARQL